MILRELMLIKYLLKIMRSQHTGQEMDTISLEKLNKWESRADQLIELWIQGWGFNFLSVYIKIFDTMSIAHTVIHQAHKIE